MLGATCPVSLIFLRCLSLLPPPSVECPQITWIMTTWSETAPDPPRYASAPFDDPDADLILRSSDNTDFRVSRFILRLASPFFASMLEIGQTLPNASGETQANGDQVRDGCRVVPVQENSDTLERLLRIIYPQKDPILSDLPQVDAVMAAALKYEMEEAIALAGAKLLSFKSKEASRVWAIAVRHGLELEAQMAADELIREKVSVLDDFPPEMQEVNAGAYYRLLQYRRLAGKVESDFKFCYPSSSKPSSSSNNVFPSAPPSASLSTDMTNGGRFRVPTDIICRSSDGKDIPAHKAILAYASPVMAEMITSLPLPAPGNVIAKEASVDRVGNPTLAFDEDGATLEALIAVSYPVFDGYEHPFLVLQKSHGTIQKYEMNDAFKAYEHRWSQFVAEDPLTAYLLAAGHRSAEGARQASLHLLDKTTDEYYVPLLERSPSSVYRDALLFHRTCKAAASASAQEFYQAADGNSNHHLHLPQPRRSVTCSNRNYGSYSHSSCCGLSASETYMNLHASPRSPYLCIGCWLLGRAIGEVVGRLASSDALYMTLKVLKASPVALDPQFSFVLAGDRPALGKLLESLYNIIFEKVTEVGCYYLLGPCFDTMSSRRPCLTISSSIRPACPSLGV